MRARRWLALFALPADAVVTATWSVETYPQWDAGDATSAFITSAGELRPGWDTKRTALEGDAVWSSLRLADGSVLLGSDAGGAIFRLAGDAVEASSSTLPGAIAVVALAQTTDGAVWAGAMPGNKLWKIDVAAGKATPTAHARQGQGRRDRVVARRGRQHRLRRAPVRRASCSRSPAAPPRRCSTPTTSGSPRSTVTADGAVWMGTSDRALVFRFDPQARQGARDGRLRGQRGLVARARSATAWSPRPTISPSSRRRPARPRRRSRPPRSRTPPRARSPSRPTSAPSPAPTRIRSRSTDLGRKGAKKGKGALFRIGKDGRLDQLHALTQTYFTSVAVSPDGAVYAGAADKGRIYMVDTDDSVATAFDVDERAVSQLWFEQEPARVHHRRRRRGVPLDRPRLAGALRQRRARRQGGVAVRQADVVGGRQGQARDPQRQHREAGRRLERVAGARRRSASSAAATRAARSRARSAATCSSGSRSRTTPRASAA